MPKQKTRKSAAKRFKITGSGKVMHRAHFIRHLRSIKGKKRLRSLKQMRSVEGKYKNKVKRMLGIK